MFHDSAFVAPLFSWEAQPLAAHFKKSTFVWLGATDAAIKRFLEMERYDLVVEQVSERTLRFAPPPPI
jgi:hypothetical protein